MEDKNKKIAVVALIFALLALTQAQAITNATMTLIAGTGINITQSGDNYTISATGNITALPDNTKVNKSGDTMTGKLKVNTTLDAIQGISLDQIGVYARSVNAIGLYADTDNGQAGYFSGDVGIDGQLDMNGNNISNCGNCLTNETMAHDNTKVNKSGDTMTGNLSMDNNSIIDINILNVSNGITLKNVSNYYLYSDNFSTDLNNWSITGSASIVSGELKIIGNGAWNANGVVFKTRISPPYTLEWDCRQSATNINSMEGLDNGTSLAYSTGAYLYRNSTGFVVLYNNDTTYQTGNTSYSGVNTHNKLQVSRNGVVDVYINNTHVTNPMYITSAYPSFQVHGSTKISYIDNVTIYRESQTSYWCLKSGASGELYTIAGGC